MSNLRLLTSGESHGKVVLAVIEGFPAGVEMDAEKINLDLRRRQAGYGRGQRMKIEKDQVEFLSGVRKGESIGAPITLAVWNKDSRLETTREVDKPRPGHSDLAGYLKYNTGIRNVLERASARETVARVAAGSLAQLLLREFGLEIFGHVIRIGPAAIPDELDVTYDMMRAADLPDGGGEVRCVHEPTAQQMVAAIEQAKKDRDTLGGTIEIIMTGLPVGLGSHVQWDRKLDGRIAQAVMSIQAMKAVEIGLGTRAAALPGSQVHDPIHWDAEMNRQPGSGGYWRGQNGSGGTGPPGPGTAGEFSLYEKASAKSAEAFSEKFSGGRIRTYAPSVNSKWLRRHRRRHEHRRAARRTRHHETYQHADGSAAEREHPHQRAGRGGHRTLGRLLGAGGERGRRKRHRVRRRRCVSRKVRRRQPGRNPAQLRSLPELFEIAVALR